MKANIKLSLFELSPVKLLVLIKNVIAKLTGNTNFATPAVSLVAMTNLADKLEDAIEEATNGSLNSKQVRDQYVLEGREMLRVQADYVRTVAAGDAAILGSSGFAMAKQREPVGLPGTPADMQARANGVPGDLDLRWKSVRGAHGYQMWYTDKDPSVPSNWVAMGYSTRVRHTVNGLDSLKPYWFCVSAIGTAGEGPKSDAARGIAA